MAGNLHFDVDATNSASGEFAEVAAELEALARKLKDLDGKSARVKAEVAVAGAAALEKLDLQLKALPNRTTTHVNVDVDRDASAKLSGLAQQALRLGTSAAVTAIAVAKLRSAAKNIIDPESPSLLRRASQAFGVMHGAANLAAPVIDRLRSGLVGLNRGLLATGAAGAAVKVLAGAITSVTQLSGAALLAPAAILGVGAAFATVKLATAGFSDALTGSAKKQAEAYAAMGPAARGLVDTLRQLGPAANSFRKAIQDTAVRGLSDQVRALANSYLPILKTGLTGVATQLNGMVTAAATSLRSISNVSAVRTILTATDAALGRMRLSLANVLTGFLTLGAAGSAWLPRLAAAIDSAAAKFSAWASRITADGSFNRWVGGAVSAFSQLGQLLRNIGSIAGTVFGALNSSGVGLFGTLVGLTAQLRSFLQSAQGATALRALAQTLQVAGDAVQRVFGAALRQLGPILSTIAPLVQAFAVAISGNLVTILNVVGPLLQRFAAELAQHPALLVAVAHAAALVTIGFAPMAAVISLVATTLKALLIAQLVGKGLELLGLQGSVAGRVLQALVSPLRLIGELGPLVARGIGMLAAQLGIMAGPIGVLVVLFAALYASSSQFRDAANQVAATIGGIFLSALRTAGETIASTVAMLQQLGATIGNALSGVTAFGSQVASVFGPVGRVVSDVLSSIFGWLGKLPGVALAAWAAFAVLGRVAPLFTAASTAVAGFAARLAAFQASSAIGAAGLAAASSAAAKFSTALSKIGGALPLVGVALIALGALYDEFGSKAETAAGKVLSGTLSVTQAIAQETAQLERQPAIIAAIEGRVFSSSTVQQQAYENVTAAIKEQYDALSPMQKLEADVAMARQRLADAVAQYTANSPQAVAASRDLAVAEDKLKTAQDGVANSTKTATDRLKEQADQMSGQVNSALAYAQAVKRTADAQREANEEFKKSGANSDAYKEKLFDVASAMQQQASAARQQAESLGGAEAGARAYTAELLKMDHTSQAGRDAFALLASGLDDAGLAALSAAAQASHLRTEILTLPDGRKVTVVVAADQGKLPELKQAVNEITQKKYVGTVQILATNDLAKNAVLETVQLADGTKATIKISGDASPSILTVGQTKYTIDNTTGTLQVLGNVAPGETSLAGLKLKIDATTGRVTLDANPAAADAKLALTVGRANTSVGVVQIDGNPTLVDGKITASVILANGSTGVITVDGNPDPATGKINGTIKYADGSTGRITVDANDGPARSKVAGTVSWINSQHPTITVSVQYTGSSPAAVHQAGYARGGIVRPVHAAGGLVLPGYAPGRDTVPAMLSPGEGVLVPPLVRELGAARVIAANAAARSGRGAEVLAGSGGPGRVGAAMSTRGGTSGGAAAAAMYARGLAAVAGQVGQLRGDVQGLGRAIRTARPITVEDKSGNPTETARATSLALKFA